MDVLICIVCDMIKILKELNTKLEQLEPGTTEARGKLFMLGKNEDNVCIEAFPMRKNYGGCGYMPGITRERVAETHAKLQAKKLTFGGFLRIWPYRTDYRSHWSGSDGNFIYHNPEIPLVTYGGNIKWVTTYKKGRISYTKVSIVNGNKNIQKTTRRTTRTKKAKVHKSVHARKRQK